MPKRGSRKVRTHPFFRPGPSGGPRSSPAHRPSGSGWVGGITVLRSPECSNLGSMVFAVVLVLMFGLPIAMAHAAEPPNAADPKTRHPYRKHWKHATVGKGALAGVAAGAGLARVRRTPRKWGGGGAGFGKRLGAGMATHAVKTTVEHGVAARLHEDLHYHRSTQRGFAPRLGHALTSTVVTSNTKNGKRTPAIGRISGNAAAGAVSQGLIVGAGGASTAGLGLAADAGANVVREFVPRRHRRRPRPKPSSSSAARP